MSPAADSSPLTITSAQLTYADSERKAHYQGGVVAKGTDFTATCQALDVFLRARSQIEAQSNPVSWIAWSLKATSWFYSPTASRGPDPGLYSRRRQIRPHRRTA